MKRLILATLLIAATTTAALAHSKSEKTVPANAATVASVETIAISFNDPMRVTAISLTGPEGAVDLERETGMEPTREFSATPTSAIPDGPYDVEWRGLSADGHPMQGTFSFTVSN